MTDAEEEAITAQMAEGEMDIELAGMKFHTKGFRLYSLVLLALTGFLVMAYLAATKAVDSTILALVSSPLMYLLGVFTGKKT